MSRKIAIACDHRGFELKEKVRLYLKGKHYQVVDCGTHSEKAADYPDFIFKAAAMVGIGDCDRGIGICYSGVGSSIAANKVPGVRAALCRSVEEAELSRLHNDSNMLILGSGFLKEELLLPILEVWLKTSFEGGRHERRIEKIKEYEQKRGL